MEVIENINLEHTPEGIAELKKILKSGKAVRNPFGNNPDRKNTIIVVDNDEYDTVIEVSRRAKNTVQQ